MQFKHVFSSLVFVLAVSLAGCGGGGGGAIGSAAVDGTVLQANRNTSGLVPDAGAVGATLYADAAKLRVLRDGAVWHYRGSDQSAFTKFYKTTVTHVATNGTIAENASNSANDGPDTTERLRFEGGAYRHREDFPLGTDGTSLAIDLIELRSPVKVNDLYVSLDSHIADGRLDADGDHINDAVDIAVFSRVIGEELLDLPNLPQMKTVRVDNTVRVRVIASSSGAVSPTFESVQSVWYAAGIGVVQTRATAPDSEHPTMPDHIYTETLTSWDGVTEGLGSNDPVRGVAPPSSTLADADLTRPFAAVAFDNHAVIATRMSANSIALAQLDTRGKVLAAREYPFSELFPGARYVGEPQLMRMGNELRVLAINDRLGVFMVALDPTGQRILRPAIAVLNDPYLDYNDGGSNPLSFHLAAKADGFWIGWMRGVWSTQNVLQSALAQRFDADGKAIGPERVVFAPFHAVLRDFNMASSDSALVFSWSQGVQTQIGFTTRWRVGVLDIASGAVIVDKTLGSEYDACRGVRGVSLLGSVGMACEIDTQLTGDARLNVGPDLVVAPGATLSDNTLMAPWLMHTSGVAMVDALNGPIVVPQITMTMNSQEGQTESYVRSVFQLRGANGSPYVTGAASTPLLLTRIADGPDYMVPPLQFPSHVLLIGENGSRLSSVVVWKAR